MLAILALTSYSFYWLQSLGMPSIPSTSQPSLWANLQYLWVLGIPMTTLSWAGWLIYNPNKKQWPVKSVPVELSWRIVTRGTNVAALDSTVGRILSEMSRKPHFKYRIEIFSDRELHLTPNLSKARLFVIPQSFQTSRGTRYKARALAYASEVSDLRDSDWIFHLDEESQPSGDLIDGIARHIYKNYRRANPEIGQGAITYIRLLDRHPFMALADCGRTGMDLGPFYLQFLLNRVILGFHGSFILVNNWVEKSIDGFNVPPGLDIAEDCYWALKAQERGHRFAWVDGFLEEQSTQHWMDFLKQRARWTEGLIEVIVQSGVKWYNKLLVATVIGLWVVTAFSAIYTISHLFYGFASPMWIRVVGSISWGTLVTTYLYGLSINLRHTKLTRMGKLKYYPLMLLWLPVIYLLEIAAVFKASLFPTNGFHVIKK